MKTSKELRFDTLINLHGFDTLNEWINSLDIFYYYVSAGGIADDNGEDFRTPIMYSDLDDLKSKLKTIGVELQKIPENSDEYFKFLNIIKKYNDYIHPGHSIVFGYKCFIWVYDEYFLIKISGNGDKKYRNSWMVDKSDYEICKMLDIGLKEIGWQNYVKRDLEKDERFISKSQYIEYLK